MHEHVLAVLAMAVMALIAILEAAIELLVGRRYRFRGPYA